MPSGLCCVDHQRSRGFVWCSLTLFVCVQLRGGGGIQCHHPPPLWIGKRDNLFPHMHGPLGRGLAPAIFGTCFLMQAPVETECTSEVLLSGVDNASGQYLDYATLRLCLIHNYSFPPVCAAAATSTWIIKRVCVCLSSRGHGGGQATDSQPGNWAALSACTHR